MLGECDERRYSNIGHTAAMVTSRGDAFNVQMAAEVDLQACRKERLFDFPPGRAAHDIGLTEERFFPHRKRRRRDRAPDSEKR